MIDENGFIQPEPEEEKNTEQQPVVPTTVEGQVSSPGPKRPRSSGRVFLVWGLIIGLLFGSVLGGIFGNYIVMSNPSTFPWVKTTNVSYPVSTTSAGSTVIVTSEEQAVENAIKVASPAVVQINTTSVSSTNLPSWFGGQQSQQEEGIGSGFIITSNGYILTNNHVIENATKITVTLKDGREFSGKVIGTDSLSDVAVVKINGFNLPTIRLGDSSKLAVGQKVIAIGNPYGLSQTVTTGSVSALERNIQTSADTTTGTTGKTLVGVIQTDAAINPGNSGGPLIDLSGNVVGINTMIYQNAQGLGFSVSSNTAKKVYESIIKNGKVTWPALGIQGTTLTADIAQQYNVKADKGVYVVAVTSGSGAEVAGIQKGDVITKIDGEDMTTIDQVLSYVRAKNVGDTVQVVINRNGQSRTLTVTLKALTAQ